MAPPGDDPAAGHADPGDANVLRRTLTICNKRGLHARAAA